MAVVGMQMARHNKRSISKEQLNAIAVLLRKEAPDKTRLTIIRVKLRFVVSN